MLGLAAAVCVATRELTQDPGQVSVSEAGAGQQHSRRDWAAMQLTRARSEEPYRGVGFRAGSSARPSFAHRPLAEDDHTKQTTAHDVHLESGRLDRFSGDV